MTASPDLPAAERDLAAARKSFNISRQALNTTLSQFEAREGATDRLIYHADEYGVDHTLTVLAKSASAFDLHKPIPQTALSSIRTQLEAAYEANHQIDLAMAKREDLALKDNPTRGKAILIGDREYIFDPKADTLRDRESGDVFKAEARLIETESGGIAPKREKERDR